MPRAKANESGEYQTIDGLVAGHQRRMDEDSALVAQLAHTIRKADGVSHETAVLTAGMVLSGWYAKGIR
jgi:hypothetical protein